MITGRATSAIRRGLYDGLVVGVVVAGLQLLDMAVLKNPHVMTDDAAHDSLEKIAFWWIALALSLGYVAIGAHGRLREPDPHAGAKAGAMAGLVTAVMLVLTTIVLDRLLFDVVLAHHKAVDTPGGPPITHESLLTGQVGVLFVLAPLATILCALLGQVGGFLVDRRRGELT